MRISLASMLFATVVGLGSVAYAADPPKPAAPTDATAGSPQTAHGAMDRGTMGHGSRGQGMMGHGAMDMGSMSCMSLSGERLAVIKAELKISSVQSPQWDAFADAMKSNATVMRDGMMHGDGHGARPESGMTGSSLPERLERHEAMMTAHLEALHKVRTAVSPLYGALTSDQRAKAERLLCDDSFRHGPRAAKGQDAHPHHSQ